MSYMYDMHDDDDDDDDDIYSGQEEQHEMNGMILGM